MIELTSQFLCLTIDPENGQYSLKNVNEDFPCIDQARVSVHFRHGLHLKHVLGHSWKIAHITETRQEQTSNGSAQMIDLTCQTSVQGVSIILRFALLQDSPLALMQMTLDNQSTFAIHVDKFTFLDMPRGALRLTAENKSEMAFYSNGWQSWSSSGVYGIGENQRCSNLGSFQNPMVVNRGTPKPRLPDHFTSDMYGVLGDRSTRKGFLAGFLSQKQHFGSLEVRLHQEPMMKMWANGDGALLNSGQQITTDWAAFGFIHLDDEDPMQDYLQAVARENNAIVNAEVPVGWCSWYYFYSNVTAGDIRANLRTLVDLRDDLPLSLLQIDDGFEKWVGDWLTFNDKFPQGVKLLADEIKQSGITPGLWLAPFIVQPQAQLIRDHPDWILRNRLGKRVTAGFVWNRFTAALDLTHPDALAYTCEVVDKAAHEWGFPYLKLDFLYAAALGGKYSDPTKTRAQVLRLGLEAIREAVGPETTLLACGCPLGSALGLFEAMRVSADVSGVWNPEIFGISRIFRNEPHMPSARNAIQNILSRAHLHRHWWVNDPDCLLIRPDSKLTLAEVQSLTTAIAVTGGSMLLSDDLPALPQERLDMAKLLIPLIGKRPVVLDWFDKATPERLRLDLDGPSGPWYILACFNWSNQDADLIITTADWGLPKEITYTGRELWTGEIVTLKHSMTFNDVPPHGVRLIALRQFDAAMPCYLGSDLHISQGLEVNDWQVKASAIQLSLALPHKSAGQILLWLPKTPKTVLQDGKDVDCRKVSDNCYSISVNFNKHTDISMSY
mgnify:CR=1 FL=1